MSEVNNKTLAGLLVVAIVVSLGGTFISLNKLGSTGGEGTLSLTGFGEVENGTITLNVTKTLSINLTDATLDLGTGQPDSGVATFSCDSDDGTAVNWTPTSGCTADRITVENVGSVVANVSLTNLYDAENFLCGHDTSACGAVAGSAQVYQWKVDSTANCNDEPTTYTDFTNTTSATACNQLGGTKNFNITAYVVAPADFDGDVTDTVTFTAIEAGTAAAN